MERAHAFRKSAVAGARPGSGGGSSSATRRASPTEFLERGVELRKSSCSPGDVWNIVLPEAATRPDVVVPVGSNGARRGIAPTVRRRHAASAADSHASVTSFWRRGSLARALSEGARRGFGDQRFEERQILALFGVPEDAEREAPRSGPRRPSSVPSSARGRLAQTLAEPLERPDGGATSPPRALAERSRRASCPRATSTSCSAKTPGVSLCSSSPTPVRAGAARGRRRARRSAPASRGRSRAPAGRARARPASARARSRPARGRRRPSPDARSAP